MKRCEYREGRIKKAAVPIVRGLEAKSEVRSALDVHGDFYAQGRPNLRPGEIADPGWGIFQKEVF